MVVLVVTQFSLQSPLGLSITSILSSSQWRLWNRNGMKKSGQKMRTDIHPNTYTFFYWKLPFFIFLLFDFKERPGCNQRIQRQCKTAKAPLASCLWLFDACQSVSHVTKEKKRKGRIRRRITRLKNIRNENGILSKRRTAKEETLCLLVCVCVYIKIVLCSSLFFWLGRGAAVEINSRLHVTHTHTHTHTRLNIIEKFPLSLNCDAAAAGVRSRRLDGEWADQKLGRKTRRALNNVLQQPTFHRDVMWPAAARRREKICPFFFLRRARSSVLIGLFSLFFFFAYLLRYVVLVRIWLGTIVFLPIVYTMWMEF